MDPWRAELEGLQLQHSRLRNMYTSAHAGVPHQMARPLAKLCGGSLAGCSVDCRRCIRLGASGNGRAMWWRFDLLGAPGGVREMCAGAGHGTTNGCLRR